MPTPKKPPEKPEPAAELPPVEKKPGVTPPLARRAVGEPKAQDEPPTEPAQLPVLPPEPPGGPPINPPGQVQKLEPPFAASEGMVPELRATQSEIKRTTPNPNDVTPPKTPPRETNRTKRETN